MNAVISAYSYPGVVFTLGNERLSLINSIVCAYFGVPEESIMDTSRKRDKVIVRQYAHYFMQKYSSMTLTDIASHIHMNHTTLIYSRHTINNLCEFDAAHADIRFNIDELIVKALNDDDLQDN